MIMRPKSNGKHVLQVAQKAWDNGFDAMVGRKEKRKVVVILGSGIDTLDPSLILDLSGVSGVRKDENPLGDDFHTFEPIFVPVERSVT